MKICLYAVGIPVLSLPVAIFAVILPISFPISRLLPALLSHYRIEMLIMSPNAISAAIGMDADEIVH